MASNPGKPDGTQISGVDYKCVNDDAWYAVKLVLKDETLVIKYIDFTDMFDDKFKAGKFKSLKEIDEFEKRFRTTSRQLQDNECFRVIEGMPVCASYAFSEEDVRFYDAVVEEVNFTTHSKEECTCTFLLFWEHGPNAGNKTSNSIQNICLLQSGSGEIDPSLTQFLKICREKILVDLDEPNIIPESDTVIPAVITAQKRTSSCSLEENRISKLPKRSVITRMPKGKKVNHHRKVGQETDLRGMSKDPTKTTNCYFVLIENLEKDLTPPVIVEFISKNLAVSSQAQVFPCITSEPYTRGIIVVSGDDDLQKLYDFLNDPAHIIVSSRGRPWVIPEDKSWCGAFIEGTFGSLMVHTESQPLSRTLEVNNTLELVRWGTEKYKKGKQLQELFIEFVDHVRGLYKKFALEESKIWQPR